MKIRFYSSIDDVVDAHLRLYDRSDIAKKRKWLGLLGAPLVGVAMYVLFPGSPTTQLVWAVGAMLIYVIGYLATYQRLLAKGVRKYLQETYGGDDDKIACELDFGDEHVACRWNGTELSFKWSNVTEIVTNDDDFEIWIDKKGLVVVRHAIFDNPYQQKEWLDYARLKTEISQIEAAL
ncbi:hypothetical protein GF377_05180 [candidate division GN15 bacterium]|nr:hypothetical protein [candidate division GN15 bacterium]